MMELEQQYTSLYKSQNQFAVKRERTREVEAMACVAEDLSLPSKKLKKSGTSSPSKFMCDKTENSRLPEGTFLKTGVITQVMGIQEPISKLRSLLENHLGIDLSNFQIWLQDKLKMLPHKSLGEQCIQNEGLAQIKVELKQVGGHSRINIIDVLRFPEDCAEADADEDEEMICPVEVVEDLSMGRSGLVEEETTSNETIPSKWTIYEDINSLFPIPLPNDPSEWTEVQIHHWLQWAIQEFKIAHVSETFWNITGKQLCQMSLDEFRRKVPVDPQNHLWTHIELLRKCHIFAVIDKSRQHSNASSVPQVTIEPSITPKVQNKNSRKPRTPSSSSSGSSTNGNRNISTPTLPLITVSTKRPAMTGHNGQIQLWQFLLELLGDTRRKDVIQWVGRDGEFKLNDPELVAQMWGERKNKPKMNYEKLSRALRYYYHDGMIAKVHGRRFVYKFERKLKELIGLSTEELISIGEGEESMKSAEM